MNKMFWRGITTTTLTTALGTAMFLPTAPQGASALEFNYPVPTIADFPGSQTEKLPDRRAVSNPVQLAQARKSAGNSGRASWYGPGFHGRPTASGERFNQQDLTAAHRTLPFGTKVKVTNLHNGRSVVVRINDRGPFSRGRVIDLSKAAARIIGLFQSGTAPVRLEVMGR